MAGPCEKEVRATWPNGICAPDGVATSTRAHLVEVAAKIPLIAHIDGVSFPAFDVFGDILPSDGRSNSRLDVLDRQAVAGRFRPIGLDFDVKALRDPLREHGPHLMEAREKL